ncbi:MAG: RagB/SusD family nutrient uptake outer membrane protein [Candidatus Pseudobacter hemicellulosilyticus]|uniref:RagB/SusD family nutrient uptake outer membrane protein n=1 Tax=Candidatus Pseudobacter hemicellulosilyticus TaxID=3121375 RepID=A0AAJ5WMP9_9BACT|nr:MAG: RagB/SusD family nutrient uptake outer membrane protein [Pseudobacter sp.]
MKRTYLLYSTLFMLILAAVTGCKKYLDQVPNDRITMDEVFRKKSPSEQYLANIYSYVNDESNEWSEFPWFGNADEGDATWSRHPIYELNMGNINADITRFDKWGYYYNAIRSATYFMQRIDENIEIRNLNGQQLIDQYKAEARCLRACYYFMLMRQYGPVVLVGDSVLATDIPANSMQLERSPYDDCVNYVSAELDKAAEGLPLLPSSNGQESNLEYGRMTKGIALAIKSRLLLYAASPLYNGNADMAGFNTKEGQPLIAQSVDKEKWKRAADAAKAVIDLALYSLYKDPGGDVKKSLEGIFFKAWNDEQIFVRKANNLYEWDTHAMPRQAGGWCGLAVTQEQVDAYFMKDGLSITESPLYAETGFTTVNGVSVYNMYLDREPRFYTSVTYNNSLFQGGNMQTAAAISFFISGSNGKNGHPTDYSKTGYLVRKNVGTQTNSGSGGNGQRQERPIILFRLGEIYLNYAEAMNEYEPGNVAILQYLNLIRERAGVPQYGQGVDPLPAPASQQAMREKIHAERRVELAFEGHRWFDIRRWKIAQQVMGQLHGMDINKDGNEFYKRVPATIHLFRPAYYWMPISQYEMDRSKLMVQNPGW